MSSDGGAKKTSFWTTLPGILTGIAALLTATGGLVAALCQAGVICGDDSDQVEEVSVSALRDFTPTPFLLNQGDVVTIRAEGEMFDDIEGNPSRSFTPDGVPDPNDEHGGDPLTSANHAALLARIGAEGALLEVGSRATFEADRRGRLFLGINDGRFDDNRGGYTATVRVARAARD